MKNLYWPIATFIALGIAAAVLWYAPKPTTPPGTMPVGSIKGLMEGIVDPTSDVLFDAVSTQFTKEGTVEREPRTDDEWANVQHNALMLAEAANLLVAGDREVAFPSEGTTPESGGPELDAGQIRQKIAADRMAWNRAATVLQATAVKALKAANERDARALFDTGDDIDKACENCHRQYWYPNQN